MGSSERYIINAFTCVLQCKRACSAPSIYDNAMYAYRLPRIRPDAFHTLSDFIHPLLREGLSYTNSTRPVELRYQFTRH